MPPEQQDLREALHTPNAASCLDDANFWNCLINEKVAAKYLGLTDRTMQVFRQRGGGPR